MKRSTVFCFVDGQLTIKTDGHGDQAGWGCFAWDEDQVEVIPYDEKPGSYIAVEIPKSELIEPRDFLCRVFPKDAALASS